MKKSLYLFIVLVSLLWSCEPEEEVGKPGSGNGLWGGKLEICVDLVFEAEGGEKSFRIACHEDTVGHDSVVVEPSVWTIENESDWCRTDVASGVGDRTVVVTAEAYDGEADRNTNLVIRLDDEVRVLTVTQKRLHALTVSRDKFDVPEEGGEVSVEVTSNMDYRVRIPAEFEAWISEVPASKALESRRFTFTVAANREYARREGCIIFESNGVADTVRIYQTADPRTLVLTKDHVEIAATGGTVDVELKTNVDYEIIIPESAAQWVSLVQTRAVRVDKFRLEVSANPTYECRLALVRITDKNNFVHDTITLKQEAREPYIGDLLLQTEQDVIDFRETGHTKVIGNVTVGGHRLESLKELNSLLTEIDGTLTICCFPLQSFEGLGNLKKVTGDFLLEKGRMGSFKGLESLESVGGNFVRGKWKREIGDFMDSVHYLSSFQGLNQLKNIGGNLELNILYCYNFQFEGLESLRTIGGNLELAGEFAKTKSLKGLENLETIGGGELIIKDFQQLDNIDALSKVSSLNEISITDCPKLYDFCVLKNVVQHMSGTFTTAGNGYNPTKEQLLGGECSQIPNN